MCNNKPRKNVAIILAGGKGSRFCNTDLKQNYRINDRTLLQYCLHAFTINKNIDGIVVVASKETKIVSYEFGSKILGIVESGKERYDSVRKGIDFISKNFTDVKNVLIHDCARPLVSQDMIDTIVLGLKTEKAIVPVLKINDTLKKIRSDNVIIETKSRESIFIAQTPQGFDFDVFKNCCKEFNFEKNATKITDDSAIVEFFGIKVRAIPGSFTNIKITYKEDLNFAKVFLDKGLC